MTAVTVQARARQLIEDKYQRIVAEYPRFSTATLDLLAQLVSTDIGSNGKGKLCRVNLMCDTLIVRCS